MSLSLHLMDKYGDCKCDLNITHNLTTMAEAAGLYKALWRPEEIEVEGRVLQASDLVPILEEGLRKLRENPAAFKQYNPSNGWGDYEGLVRVVEEYLEACRKYSDCLPMACR